MPVSVRRLAATFVGEMSGVDLARPGARDIAAVKAEVEGRRAVHSAATADRRVGIQLSTSSRADV
jgi:hypothetical protein